MEEYKINRLWVIAAVAVTAIVASCQGNNIYQERKFKQAALEKNMSASAIACAWSDSGNSSSTAACVLEASK